MEAKKIGDLLPKKQNTETTNDQVAIVRKEKLNRAEKTKELIKVFNSLEPAAKYRAVRNQIRGVQKTCETVTLPGRVMVSDEPEIMYMLVVDLFHFAGQENEGIIRSTADVLIETYGWMALQDFALYFRKIKAGIYGEIYGKMNGMWITGKIKNFQESVKYNLIIDQEAEHFALKQINDSRDLSRYYDDIRPDIVE